MKIYFCCKLLSKYLKAVDKSVIVVSTQISLIYFVGLTQKGQTEAKDCM